MHPVLALVEDGALGPLDDAVGHLLAPVAGEAVHEDGVGLRPRDGLVVDLVGGEGLLPLLDVLVAHAVEGVRVDDVGAREGLLEVVGDHHLRAPLLGVLLGEVHDHLRGSPALGDGDVAVHPHEAACHHQGLADVVGVADVGELVPLDLALVLPDGEEVGEPLAGVGEVGEGVDDGVLHVLGVLLDDLLAVGPDDQGVAVSV